MFGLFKQKTEVDKLNIQYKKILEEAYQLSTSNRKLSDLKYAEANELLKRIDQLSNKN